MRSALLRGPDQVVLGALATIAEGRVAIALSRGGAAKTYAYLDPNEDAALFAYGARGALVAVADGHAGHEASICALEFLLSERAEGWTEGPAPELARWPEAAGAALAGANAAIRKHAESAGRARPPRTTLALALVRPEEGRLLTAAIGDSHLFRVADGAACDLAAPLDTRVFFLGHAPETPATLAPKLRVEEPALSGTTAVVLATDGLSEQGIGVAAPGACVARAAEACRGEAPELRARELVRRLVDEALEAQRRQRSGDNVALAAWVASAARSEP